jgi:hypothetical protein
MEAQMLHPDSFITVANQLHQERIVEARNAARARQLDGGPRRPAGRALGRAGAWLRGPANS